MRRHRVADLPRRDGHPALHRHRGLDAAAATARRALRATSSTGTASSSGPRSRATAGIEVDTQGRRVHGRLPQRARTPSRPRPTLQRALAAEPWPRRRARAGCGSGIHTGEPERGAGGLRRDGRRPSRRGSAPSRTGADRRLAADARPRSVDAGYETLDLGQPPPEGHPRARAALPARGRWPAGVASRRCGRWAARRCPPSITASSAGRTTSRTIEALLARPDVRLVTITGPAGRARAGSRSRSPPRRPSIGRCTSSGSRRSRTRLVPAAIARAVGARESAGRSLVESIADAARGNAARCSSSTTSSISAGGARRRRRFSTSPRPDVLVDEPAPLRLSGEHVLPLDPLPIDDARRSSSSSPRRAASFCARTTLPSVREICRRLDGLPLAIELVAARLVVLPPAQSCEALDEGLALEMEGPVDLPERQRTLRRRSTGATAC